MTEIQQISKSIKDAAAKMQDSQGAALYTPLTKSLTLSRLLNAHVYLKEENRQFTGSFKYRGALHKILTLSKKQQVKGVVSASSGNHGMACAYAARQLDIPCDVFVPAAASSLKVAKIEMLGAHVHKVDGDCLQAELAAQQLAKDKDCCYLSPYNDLDVIAGQGTIGLEIHEQLSEVDQVYVSVGGGGLISGIGSYLKSQSPKTEIVACWAQNSPVMFKCMQANSVIHVQEKETLSDGTAGNIEDDALTLPLCQSVIDHSMLVSEQEIKDSILFMLEHEQTLIEGAAGVALASAIKNADHIKAKTIVIVICGKNIGLDTVKKILS